MGYQWWRVHYIDDDGNAQIWATPAINGPGAKKQFHASKGKDYTITKVEPADPNKVAPVQNQIKQIATVQNVVFDDDRGEYIAVGVILFAVDEHGIVWSMSEHGGSWKQLPSLPDPTL